VDPGSPDRDRLVPGVVLQGRTKTPFYRIRRPLPPGTGHANVLKLISLL
jgi:hypothetical protein